jgi:hypothetical protein
MNRSCQRQMLGFDTPARRVTAAVSQPYPAARIFVPAERALTRYSGPL